MARIYTRTGDEGSTALPDGTRVRKDDPRIELFGALDEANCLIGLARVNVVDSDVDAVLEFLQHRLFNCSACLALGQPSQTMPAISAEDITALETAIDRFTDRLGGFRGFTLPRASSPAIRARPKYCPSSTAPATCSTPPPVSQAPATSAPGTPTRRAHEHRGPLRQAGRTHP